MIVSSLIVTDGVPEITISESTLLSACRLIGSNLISVSPSLYRNRLFKALYPKLDTVKRKVEDLTPLKIKFPSISVLVNNVSFPAIYFTVAAIILVPVESLTTPLISRLVCAIAP